MTLKVKSKQVLDIIAANPKVSQTDAYLIVHKTAKRTTAASNAHQLIKKPEAQIYLEKHIQKAKNKVVQLIDSEREDIALRASDSLLDRALGKATQNINQQSTSVEVKLDLSGVRIGAHYLPTPQEIEESKEV